MIINLVGGAITILKKYESQWEGLSRILWKIKNVPNHQPDMGVHSPRNLTTAHHGDLSMTFNEYRWTSRLRDGSMVSSVVGVI